MTDTTGTTTQEWTVQLHLSEHDGLTKARADLLTRATLEGKRPLQGFGVARLHPGEPDVPEIGDEIAAARALRDLADRLLGAASDDLTALGPEEVELRR